jgi:Zn-dependent metalloprotease
LDQRRPENVVKAGNLLLGKRDEWALGRETTFLAHDDFTNPQGRTVIRFTQAFHGQRVWGGEAIAHVEPGGEVTFVTSGLKKNIALAPDAWRLTGEDALALALRDLAPQGPLARPAQVERVVFPVRFMTGLVTRFDRTRGVAVFDAASSTWARRPAQPYVWAYEVRTLLTNAKDGHREMSYVIDATSGAILRRWDATQHISDQQGVGNSYYRGAVPLATIEDDDGTYALYARSRGTKPQPYLQSQGVEQLGLRTYYSTLDETNQLFGIQPYAGNVTDTWGDGMALPLAWNPNLGAVNLDYSEDGSTAWASGAVTPTGQTAAVDAHFAMTTAWDMFENVFQRDGIDGNGTSLFGIVHFLSGTSVSSAQPLTDATSWSPGLFAVLCGDGSYALNSNAPAAMTEIDLIGHELAHGVTNATAQLFEAGLSGALNEGTSDIFGKLVQAYSDGGGTGATIPDFAPGDLQKWKVGFGSRPAGPFRFMYKPSLDGRSADEAFGGVEDLDIHWSSGVVNRFFYFLSEGAPSDPTSVRYSRYLPGGMTGLGNDRAGHIWYKTLTEHLTADADFNAARAAAVTAAQELFGADSDEVKAVMNAWAAVNVGSAPGEGPRVQVSMPVINPAGSFLETNAQPTGILSKVQIFPVSARVLIRATVQNASDPGVDFSLPPPGALESAGTINADGTWTTPDFTFNGDLIPIRATSRQDPREYAIGQLLLVNLDADTDDEQDAIDLGFVAMSWDLAQTPYPTAPVSDDNHDWGLVFFAEAFNNAWPVQGKYIQAP